MSTETPPVPPRPAESTPANPRPNYRKAKRKEPRCKDCASSAPPLTPLLMSDRQCLVDPQDPDVMVFDSDTCDAHTPINSVTSGT